MMKASFCSGVSGGLCRRFYFWFRPRRHGALLRRWSRRPWGQSDVHRRFGRSGHQLASKPRGEPQGLSRRGMFPGAGGSWCLGGRIKDAARGISQCSEDGSMSRERKSPAVRRGRTRRSATFFRRPSRK